MSYRRFLWLYTLWTTNLRRGRGGEREEGHSEKLVFQYNRGDGWSKKNNRLLSYHRFLWLSASWRQAETETERDSERDRNRELNSWSGVEGQCEEGHSEELFFPSNYIVDVGSKRTDQPLFYGRFLWLSTSWTTNSEPPSWWALASSPSWSPSTSGCPLLPGSTRLSSSCWRTRGWRWSMRYSAA